MRADRRALCRHESLVGVGLFVLLSFCYVMIYTSASITISEMSQKTGVVIRTIKRDIEKLQASGILTRKGGRKDGEWLLTELGQRVLEERSANKTV